MALHTVTVCDLASEEMECEGSAVLGPPGRVFYVSPGAVYVWTARLARRRKGGEDGRRSVLYRIPLDGSGPTALGVAGSPVDQFSFLESGDGHLNVLVRSDGAGDGMWNAEHTGGDAALLRIPLGASATGAAAPAGAVPRAAGARRLHLSEPLRGRLPAVRHGERLGRAGRGRAPRCTPCRGRPARVTAAAPAARGGPHRGDGR